MDVLINYAAISDAVSSVQSDSFSLHWLSCLVSCEHPKNTMVSLESL